MSFLPSLSSCECPPSLLPTDSPFARCEPLALEKMVLKSAFERDDILRIRPTTPVYRESQLGEKLPQNTPPKPAPAEEELRRSSLSFVQFAVVRTPKCWTASLEHKVHCLASPICAVGGPNSEEGKQEALPLPWARTFPLRRGKQRREPFHNLQYRLTGVWRPCINEELSNRAENVKRRNGSTGVGESFWCA